MPPPEPLRPQSPQSGLASNAERCLPTNPSLNLLGKLAKQLRKGHAAGDSSVLQRIRDAHPQYAAADDPQIISASISLRDAQLVIAREYGFENWAHMKRHVEAARDIPAPETSGEIGGANRVVPMFAVFDMTTSLAHYVDRLGFRMTKDWMRDGQLAWCWLEHGSAALMLTQYRTVGKNARVFEGRRGGGCEFAFLRDGDERDWPHHGVLSPTVDSDGYTLLAADDALSGESSGFVDIVPTLNVVNMDESIRFYTEGIGFRETDRWNRNGDTHRCRLTYGSVSLLLIAMSHEERSALSSGDKRGQGVEIMLMCDDALAIHSAVTSRGINTREPFVGNRLWVVGMSDPDGYRVTFESPTDEPEEMKLSERRNT